jgi:hypothetical protein
MLGRPSRMLGFHAMKSPFECGRWAVVSGRLISRRERQAFVCAVMAAQGERAAS